MKTPLILISGYLGAGKTTLLQHLLSSSHQKIAVLMNEFGEVGVDTQTIKGKNIAVKELLEGCVCCSLQGEFEAGVKEIILNYTPDLILVETTGIAEADNLVVDIEEDFDCVKLQCVVTLVDAGLMERFSQITGNLLIQIEVADLLILNKVDLVQNTEKLHLLLRGINSSAQIIETQDAKVDLKDILAVSHSTKKTSAGSRKHGFESFSVSVSGSLDRVKLIEFLKQLPANIERVKGYCTVDGDVSLLNFATGEIRFSIGYGTQKLVFIGRQIMFLKQEIEQKLNLCYA